MACREAALKVKTTSGIKRFQDEKEYGSWFQKLLPIISSTDSCQPEQAIEPGHENLEDDDSNGDESSTSTLNQPTSSTGNQPKKRNLFVPIHETARKSKKVTSERHMSEISSSINDIKAILENDPTKELLNFLKEDQ